MPRAHTHQAVAVSGAVAIAAAWYYAYGYLSLIAGAACLVGEFWAGPDRDLDNGVRRWTWWATCGWIWALYSALVPHRSRLSHWPLLGVAGRLLYVGGPVVLALWLSGHGPAMIAWEAAHHRECVAAYLGLEAAGVLHWLADRCP